MLPLVRRVIAQTRARILGGDKHYRDKVFSLFEPHTEAIRKGKASKPTEFGKLVKIQEAENQFVVDYQVYERRPDDRTLAIPTLAAHQQIFGRPPHLFAADRGFWSHANKHGCQDRRRQEGVYTRRWKALSRTTRRATSTVVSPRPACTGRMRGPNQRHEAARRPHALSLSRPRRNPTLGRLGRGQQQPLGSDHCRPPPAQTSLKNSPPTIKSRPNYFAPEIS